MSTDIGQSEWSSDRGAKWREQLPLMEAMLGVFDPVLIDALDLQENMRIAEIGCGGGGTSLAIAAHAPAGCTVCGFDISPDLIDAARARVSGENGSVSFELADAGRLSPPAEPYDRLVSRFGVMFFDDAPSAFANLHRQLKPGGRIAFAVWASPMDNPWMTGLLVAASEFIEIERPAPDTPGPFRYGDAALLTGLLEGAGFTDLAVQDWRGSISLGGGMSPEDAAAFALDSFSIGEQVREKGADIAQQVCDRLAGIFAENLVEDVVSMPARVHIVTGATQA